MNGSNSVSKSPPAPEPRWPMLLVLVTALLVYSPLIANQFVTWDDDKTIYLNAHFHPITLENVLHYWWNQHMGLWIPITYTVWALLAIPAREDTNQFGFSTFNPAFFHAASVVVHALISVLVYRLLRRWLSVRPAAALLGALAFALHPAQVETVAWVSGLKDLLSALFILIALDQYTTFAQRASWRHQLLALLAMTVGFLCKPLAVVTPALALVVDRFLLNRPWRRVLAGVWPLALLLIPMAVITVIVQKAMVPGVGLWWRPLLTGYTLAFYLLKLLWPAMLAVDYGKNPLVLLKDRWFYVAWLLPAAIALLLWLKRRDWRPVAAAALLFVVALSPVLGLMKFLFQYYSTVADHYLYLPMLGVAAAAAWLLNRHWRKGLTVGALLILGIWADRGMMQMRVWADTATLFDHTIQVNPRSWLSYNNLAAWFAIQGDVDRSIEHLRKGIDIVASMPLPMQRDLVQPRKHLGQTLLLRGRFDEAAEQLELARRANPDDAEILRFLEAARQRRIIAPATTQPQK